MADKPVQILLADWVAPMSQNVIHRGGVAFGGERILKVGPAADVVAAFPDAAVEDLCSVVLLPGLVNAHTHLELTAYSRSQSPPSSFVDWVLELRQRIGQVISNGLLAAQGAAEASVKQGIEESLRFGVTCVGDIAFNASIARKALAQSPMAGVSFGEVLGMAGRAGQRAQLLAAATDSTDATDRLRIGIEPHAPYSLDERGYRACVAAAVRDNLPICTHLAETPDEAAFLADHTGEFRRLWEALGAWTDDVPTLGGGPIRAMRSVGLLDRGALLAHVNYCEDEEVDLLAATRCSVVYCPRTHDWFGHPSHRWREMLARGINVAAGTDSRASSPDLNLVEELRLLRRMAPDVPVHTIWEMATTRAAAALGLGGSVGALTPGAWADCVAFVVNGVDPLARVLDEPILPVGVWARGERIA